jgi:phosphomannomutase
VVARPSGTEPKLKFYLQLITPAAELGDIRAARRGSATDIGRLTGELHTLLGSREPVSV